MSVRPLNRAQKIARWARREPRFAAALAAAALALIVGFAATLVQWKRADANATRAEDNAATARDALWAIRGQAAEDAFARGEGFRALRPLLQNLAETYKKMPQAFDADPVATFRRQVYVSPFFEDHMAELIEAMGGTDNILFGSDYPHPEGLALPATYTEHLPKNLGKDDVRKIMGGNLGKRLAIDAHVAGGCRN